MVTVDVGASLRNVVPCTLLYIARESVGLRLRKWTGLQKGIVFDPWFLAIFGGRLFHLAARTGLEPVHRP
jgi:hypothetical protein